MNGRVWLYLAAGLAIACASVPGPPATGLGSFYGEVHLVPREGVTPQSGGGSYGDRRLRDVEFVDYAHPGFAVVYTDGASPGGRSRLAIRSEAARVRLEPDHAAVGAGGAIEVANDTSDAHVVSVPALGLLLGVDPGEAAEIALPDSGEFEVFVLDAAGAQALVFAAPGPFTVISRSGGYALEDLPPGRHRVGVWHPRFPPASRWADLAPDSVVRLDLDLGVQGLPAAGEGAGEAAGHGPGGERAHAE